MKKVCASEVAPGPSQTVYRPSRFLVTGKIQEKELLAPWQEGPEISLASDSVKFRGFGLLVFLKSLYTVVMAFNEPFCGKRGEKVLFVLGGRGVWWVFHRETLREGYR